MYSCFYHVIEAQVWAIYGCPFLMIDLKMEHFFSKFRNKKKHEFEFINLLISLFQSTMAHNEFLTRKYSRIFFSRKSMHSWSAIAYRLQFRSFFCNIFFYFLMNLTLILKMNTSIKCSNVYIFGWWFSTFAFVFAWPDTVRSVAQLFKSCLSPAALFNRISANLIFFLCSSTKQTHKI